MLMGSKAYVCGRGMSEPAARVPRFFLATFAIALLAIGVSASTALALSPSVETKAASGITETGATLNGLVNPNGLETKFYFEYGTTVSYGSKTAEVSAGSGSSSVEKSQAVGSLTKNTTYHFRIVASNSSGTSFGADQAFTTVGPPEGLTINPETFASGEEATLKGLVDPNGQATTYQFEYGTSSGTYTGKVPASPASAGSGYLALPVSAKVTGLSPGTKYFYRIVGSSPGGTFKANEISFLSSKAPGTEILPVSGIWRSKATLSAKIEPHELATTYYFEYGPTTSYGTKTTSKEISKETVSATVTEPLSILSQLTEYHYRLVASNSAGTVVGKDQTFTTFGLTFLYAVGGAELKNSAPMKAVSTNLTIANRPCTEAEFSGEVEEEPGARQRVNSVKMQSGATGCEWNPEEKGLTVKYRAGTEILERHGLEYAKDKAGLIQVRLSPEFHVIGDVYTGGFKLAECEYNFAMSGSFSQLKALEPSLSGKTEYLKGNLSLCPPGGETVSGKFVITSEGKGVEAK